MDLSAERGYPTPLSNSTLLPLLLLSLAKQKNAPTVSTTIKKEYDYVIVGAGSAGSVIANRLSELPCVSVLLLEAGKAPPLLNDIPSLARNFWLTDLDWAFKTVPQKYTGNGLINRQVIWPSGKALGGSSVLNAMLYIRGNKKNYDDWEALGAKGWSSEDVWPYFLKLEDNKDPEYLKTGAHAIGGPVTVHRPRYNSEMIHPILEAANQFGYQVVDSNGRIQTGFHDFQATQRNGQRCSTAKAYLVPAENRTNLDILPNAFVRKVIIEKRRATGVLFDFGGLTYVVRARREVIMSAGTTNTAQLLMLSGIGHRKHLEKFNIPVVADLPVGDNFHDHAGPVVNFELDTRIPLFTEKITDPRNIAQYIQNRTGPLAAIEGVSAMAFLNGLSVSPKVDFPNYEIYFEEAVTDIVQQQLGLRPEVYEQVYGLYENKPFYVCFVHMLQPKSRGTVRLQSYNPYDPPLIDPNYLEDPQDVQDLVEGMKTCTRIGTSRPMQKIGSRPFRTLHPGCEQYADDEDSYFECQVRSVLVTFSHQVGTAKMGDPKDPTTVVDPELRVKGIDGLRVVDASVMPTVPSGNTNVPTIMVAEKASDIIKATINCHHYEYTDSNSGHSNTQGFTVNSDEPTFYEEPEFEPQVHSNENILRSNAWQEHQNEFAAPQYISKPDIRVHSMKKEQNFEGKSRLSNEYEFPRLFYNQGPDIGHQWLNAFKLSKTKFLFGDENDYSQHFYTDRPYFSTKDEGHSRHDFYPLLQVENEFSKSTVNRYL